MTEQNERMGSTSVCFDNIRYKTKVGLKRETKEILHGLSGNIPPGLTAILGPSGSGKTTLLNILAKCITSNQGSIRYTSKTKTKTQETVDIVKNIQESQNVRPISVICDEDTNELIGENKLQAQPKCNNEIVIYIPQETHLCCLLTVEETFKLAAELKLPNYDTLNEDQVQEKIKDIVETLGLAKVLDNKVSCISGGEKKRIALGIELLSDFDVLLLDEPTTGLDSISTQICIEYLKSLATNGKTIICTIHQPSATVLQRFDYLYVLSDGYCLYEGLNNNLLNILEQYNMKCPCFHNPADFIIEIASGEYGNKETSIKTKLIDRYHKSRVDSSTSCYKKLQKALINDNVTTKYVATSSRQLKALMRREYLKALRNPALTYLRLATSVLNSLVLCAIFWQIGNDGAKVWFNYNAILGFVLHLMMPSLMLTILTFPCEYAVLKRESINRWYSLKWYYAAVTLIDLPICIIYCFISNGIFYTLTAQPLELWRFVTFTSLGFLICIIAQSFGLLVGSLFNVVNGTFIGSAISFPMMLFAGFGMTFKDIPPYIQWIGKFSYLKYGVEGMAASVMGYNRSKLGCPSDDYCLYKDSQRFLDDMGVTSNAIEWDFLVLIALFIFLRIITYICLRKRVFYKA